MSLSESLNGGSQEREEGLDNEVVDDFGAHSRAEGQLEPDKEEKFQEVVEGDDREDPADVHVSHVEDSIAHPVGQPGLVVLNRSVSLQGLNTLKDRVGSPNDDCDFIRKAPRDCLKDHVV